MCVCIAVVNSCLYGNDNDMSPWIPLFISQWLLNVTGLPLEHQLVEMFTIDELGNMAPLQNYIHVLYAVMSVACHHHRY